MRYTMAYAASLLAVTSIPSISAAAEITLSLSDLQQHRSSDSSPLDSAVAEKLRLNLSDSVRLDGDTLIVDRVIGEQILDDSCNGSKLRQASLVITLPPQSKFGFDYSSILRPISASLDTRACIQATGSAVQYFGLGNKDNCTRLGSDNFEFSVEGEIDLELEVTLDPNADLRDETNLRLSPEVQLAVQIGRKSFAIDIDSTVLKSLLKDRLEDAIEDSLKPAELEEGVERARLSLQRSSEDSLGDGALDVALPALDGKLVTQLREWTEETSDFPISDDYLAKNGDAIMRAALIGDKDALSDLLGSLLACQLGSVYLEDLPRQALYAQEGDACVATTALDTALYSDAQCQQSVSVREQGISAFCLISTDKLKLGDGSASPAQVSEWMLTPGPRLAITLPSFDDSTQQPYQGSVSFKQDSTERGTCSLEMRIYTPNPGAKNLRPVLAFHGGSWSQRGAGFTGMESLMAHFSSRDMIVFAPFYRLAGDQDGPTACRQFVAEDIVADADAALDWVKANGEQYGARAGKVGLFGQSAGGFLAAWIAVNRADEIDAALLMYPPTDVGGFVDDLNSGVYSNERGVGILERFLGVDQADWPEHTARLDALSMAQQVADGAPAPAIRLIHGTADELVLPSQSERLCDALHGSRADTETAGRLQRRACGDQGQLDLIEGAEHALEVCALGATCLAGDLISATAAQTSLRQAYDWLADFKGSEEGEAGEDGAGEQDGDSTTDDSDGATADDAQAEPSGSGGGGALFFLLLPLMTLLGRRSR